ncbi:spore germination protein [Clostridium brassicae]|uniref:Spore germination protein n=1 Tax=Clostridium brassicae TaxID=2999072 RepID=A0ABT4DA62_9CLOT|nr:spore germination protein [Clostridium brassicae]MCY6959063.1 spore germination protein [Clostridium brassicae]
MKNTKYEKIIKNNMIQNLGINIREIYNANKEIFILYIPEITDRKRISEDIIKPILQYDKQEITIDLILKSIVYMDDVDNDSDENKIIDYVIKGRCVIILPTEERYIIANTYKVDKRNVEAPAIQSSLKGPRDSFTESFDTNLSLIHYRLKDEALRIEKFSVGKRTKTSTAVIYIEDIANTKYVNEVKSKLKKIDVDGIIDSSYIEKFIKKKTWGLFPEVGICERPDKACAEMLKGKICILVEGSNLTLILPKTFIEFLDASDDHYENTYISISLKFLRVLSLMITLMLSPFYIAVMSFHPDILPANYILTLAEARSTVPISNIVEITIMEIVSEILKEASLRLPKQIGAAIGIVGTIVIGQAAVTARIVSPLTVIIIALSTMTSFIAPDQLLLKPIIILKFMLIFLTGVFGIFGYTIGITFIVISIASNESLEVPFTAPLAPSNLGDLKEYIFSDIKLNKKRPSFLRTKDKTRQ